MAAAPTVPSLFSPPSTARENGLARADWITSRSSILFSAYRRDDFADPNGFLAQLNVVLEGYSDAVVNEITSPKTGLQRRSKFIPTIAEVVEACDAEMARLERIRRLSEWKTAPRDARASQHRANVFVPADSPFYPAMLAWSKEKDADKSEFCGDPDGIWVSIGWIGWPDERGDKRGATPFRQFNRDDLESMYRRNEGEAAE